MIPGGTTGVAIKLERPNKYAYAESSGFDLAVLNMLRVSSTCGISLSHSLRVKSGSSDDNPAMKCDLNIWVALSLLNLRRGTNR